MRTTVGAMGSQASGTGRQEQAQDAPEPSVLLQPHGVQGASRVEV